MISLSTLSPERRVTLVTFAAIYGIGYLSYMLIPLQIGALINSLALDEAQSGTIVTAELISLAIALFVIAPKIATYNKRKLAMMGAVILIIGHSLSATAGSYIPLVLYRICSGLGAGMVLASGNAIVAGSANPQRLFAIILTLGQFQAACFLVFLPEFITLWAHAGIYGFLAVWTLFMLLLLTLMPDQNSVTSREEPLANKFNFRILLLPSVLAMILIGVSDSSMWAFQERIANSLGLDEKTIGLVLGGALISGMSGAALAAIIGSRIGKIIPIVAGLLWMSLSYLIITHTQSQNTYIIIELSYLFAYGFVIPYLFGLNGELDPEGGAMVAANGCNLVGNALGPVCAGYIIINSGYPVVGITISFFVLLAMSMYLVAIKNN